MSLSSVCSVSSLRNPHCAQTETELSRQHGELSPLRPDVRAEGGHRHRRLCRRGNSSFTGILTILI